MGFLWIGPDGALSSIARDSLAVAVAHIRFRPEKKLPMQAIRTTFVLRPRVIPCIAAAAILSATSFGCHAKSGQSPKLATMAQDTKVAEGLSGWQRSLTMALSYQAIVVSTDQLLYWTLVTGTPATEVEFFIANAVTGVAYYVAFDGGWDLLTATDSGTMGTLSSAAHGGAATPARSEPAIASAGDDVSLSKALVYRVFDTIRVLSVTLAVGTTLASSAEVAVASAVVRTSIYIAHDYVWSFVPGRL
jgi:uncharacterized membrane protein